MWSKLHQLLSPLSMPYFVGKSFANKKNPLPCYITKKSAGDWKWQCNELIYQFMKILSYQTFQANQKTIVDHDVSQPSVKLRF